MRKLLFYTILILLITLAGCSDFSTPGLDGEELPVGIESVSRGDILQPGGFVTIEYTVNDDEQIPDRLLLTLTGPGGVIISETAIEEKPLSGWAEALEIPNEAGKGLYTLRFDFYSGEELFYTELREFFVSEKPGAIESITSYPPVLYPGGGGLIHASTGCAGESCWLRWSLDGEVIAEGTLAEGFGSIEIEAPGAEGVYSLSLEVFPVPPAAGSSFSFESALIKEVPLYVNTEQKSGINEFGPTDDFYTLFHFRGNLLNAADSDHSGIENLTGLGNPVLSVRSGMFGYYLDSESSFASGKLGLPFSDGIIEAFSMMTAFVPLHTGTLRPEAAAELIYAGTENGSVSFSTGIFPDGRISAKLDISGESWSVESAEPIVSDNVYTAVTVSVLPREDNLEMIIYADGIRAAEALYSVGDEGPLWLTPVEAGESAEFRIADGLEVLVDEVGIYHRQAVDGSVVDPDQFRRSMELEYGKFLMFADGFDSLSAELVFDSPDITINESELSIPPGGSVGFPPLFPGYEEVLFRIELSDGSSAEASAVIHVEGGSSEIVSVDFASSADTEGIAAFSLIFSKESVLVSGIGGLEGAEALAGDFSSVGYSIVNNDSEDYLKIESILVIRKNISISEKSATDADIISTEIKTRS